MDSDSSSSQKSLVPIMWACLTKQLLLDNREISTRACLCASGVLRKIKTPGPIQHHQSAGEETGCHTYIATIGIPPRGCHTKKGIQTPEGLQPDLQSSHKDLQRSLEITLGIYALEFLCGIIGASTDL
ncbi:hypothetical protein TNCV_2340171 [Trichonephila clavipes]|nr:hypothetical protein TNCV_2340171 [Trichonephila clavipes]